MEIITIIYIIAATIIGAVITYFILRHRDSVPIEKKKEWQKLQAEKESLKKNCDLKLLDCEAQSKKLEAKYKELLSEAKTETAKLDERLKQALDENTDEAIKGQIADIGKLRKKIKDLQEEIEDYEDEVDSYEKKLKNKNIENNNLQDQISEEKKNNNKLQLDLEQLQSDLEDRTQELELKIGSLSFIQEVLSAQQANDISIRDIYGKVDAVVNYVSEELKECIKESYPSISNEDEIFKDDLKRWAITKKKRWIQGKTTIAFVGEFSAGKTSIVNRILSQDDPKIPKLPVSAKASTAIPTYISGGVSTRYQFVSPDNILKTISESTFKKVSKEVLDQVKGVSSLIQYFVMTYKNPHLDKLSILDTPGFNSNDKEDAERTIGVINECDALFWVFDVNVGTINRSSIALIKENLKKPLYIVINKIDSKAKTEVNKVEQLIRETLHNENVNIKQIIHFSEKEPLSAIMKPIKSISHDTSQDAYIDNLSHTIEEIVRALDKSTKESHLNFINLQNKGEELKGMYESSIRYMSKNCTDAVKIPQYTDHKVLGISYKDSNYTMSVDKYKKLQNLLGTISNKCTTELSNLYKKQMENQKSLKGAQHDYIESKTKWKKISDCDKQFKKLIKSL